MTNSEEWKDISLYRAGQEREPWCFEYRGKQKLHITVRYNYQWLPDMWCFYCRPLFSEPRELSATNVEDAKAEALQLTRQYLEEMLGSLPAKEASDGH